MMNKKALLIAIASALPSTSAAMAGAGANDAGVADAISVLNYRFTEADLRKFERVHVTAGTKLPSPPEGVVAQSPGEGSQAAGSGPWLQWDDREGRVWSVSVRQAPDRHGVRINTTLVEGPSVEIFEFDQPGPDLDITTHPIPEPASLAMMAAGALMMYPQHRKRNGGKA